jgi:virulence factor Mce-like protein
VTARPRHAARRPHATHRRLAPRRNSVRLYGVVGLIGIVVGIAIVYISYTANGGLPLAPTDRVYVELPNAQRLQRDSDVRIGGIRVGQVQSVEAVPGGRGGATPYARLELSLSPSVGSIPVDSHVQEEPASILGASYLQLVLGTSSQRLRAGATLPLSQAAPTVQLTDLLDIFNHATATSIRSSLNDASAGFAGRGTDFNDTIGSFATVLPALQDVSRELAAPSTDLAGFIDGFDSASSALAPVSAPLASLLGDAATTFDAFQGDRGALGTAIDDAPGAEDAMTAALQRVDPSLSQLATLSQQLLPGARQLRTAVPRLDAALHAGLAPLREVGPLTSELRGLLTAFAALSRNPSTTSSLQLTVQASTELTTLLNALVPAQVQCNVIALWGRNLGLSLQVGNADEPFVPLGVVGLGATSEYAQHPTPSSNLHVNYLPHENDQECESGNEPYNANTQSLSNPGGNQSTATAITSPPAGVRARAARAGLLAGGSQ